MRYWLSSVIIGMMLITVVTTSQAAAPTLLTNFQQLVNALEQGMDVKAIIYLERCQLNTHATVKLADGNLKGSSTRFNFSSYLHDKVRFHGKLMDSVTTSATAFNEYLTERFLQNYSRLRIFENNSARLYIASYDPVTYEKKLSVDWMCQISNGQDNNAIMLFNAGL